MSDALNNLLGGAVALGLIFLSFIITGLIFGLSDYIKDRNYKKRLEYRKQFNYKCHSCGAFHNNKNYEHKNYCPNCRVDLIE